MLPTPGTTTVAEAKRKPSISHAELQDHELSDRDVVDGSVDELEYSFIADLDTQENVDSIAAQPVKASTATSATDMQSQSKSVADTELQSAPTADTTMSDEHSRPTQTPADAHDNGQPAIGVNIDPNIASIPTEEEAETSDVETEKIQCSVETAPNTATVCVPSETISSVVAGAVTDTSKGAVSKTKAAFKQFEPHGTSVTSAEQSWFRHVESNRESRLTDDELRDVVKRTIHRSQVVLRGASRSRSLTASRAVKFDTSRMPAPMRQLNDQSPKADSKATSVDSQHVGSSDKPIHDTRTVFSEGLKRMHQNTQQSTFGLLPKETLSHHLAAAEKYWDKFLTEHNNTLRLNEQREQAEAHRLLFEQTLPVYEELTNKLLARLSEINAADHAAASSYASPRGAPNRDYRDNVRETIRIEPFDGDFDKWPEFKKVFEACFHNSCVSDTAKMLHLRTNLVHNSEPYKLVECMGIQGDSYQLAWRTIRDQYEDEGRILNSIMTSFLELPKVQTPTRSTLSDLVTKTNGLLQRMTVFDVETTTWGLWIVPVLVQKLDQASQKGWDAERPKHARPEVQPLLRFISDRAERIQRSNSIPPNPSVQHTQSNAETTATGSGRPRRPAKRPRCPNPACPPGTEHQLFGCERFKSMPIKMRWDKTQEWDVCKLCLRKGHHVAKCTMKPCHQCHGNHNSWLCEKPVRMASAIAPPQAPPK